MNDNFTRLDEFAADSPEFALEMIEIFKAQAPELLSNLKAEIASQDCEQAKKAAHTLKGVCLNLGFEKLAALCKQLEEIAMQGQCNAAATTTNELEAELKSLLIELENKRQSYLA